MCHIYYSFLKIENEQKICKVPDTIKFLDQQYSLQYKETMYHDQFESLKKRMEGETSHDSWKQ